MRGWAAPWLRVAAMVDADILSRDEDVVAFMMKVAMLPYLSRKEGRIARQALL